MIRIISSRKFRLYSPDRSESVVTEGKNIIQEVPEWVLEDDMFKVAKNAGCIQLLSSRSVEKVAESSPEKIVPQNAHEEAPTVKASSEEEPEFPTLEPGGGAEIEEPEFPVNDENDEAAKKAAKKAARAARKAKREK